LFVRDYNHQPSGYVAFCPSLTCLVVSLPAGFVGLLLLVSHRTRVAGISTLVATALFGLTFVGGASLSYRLGYTKWKNAPMVRFGPDVEASMVIYFRRDTSEQQLQDFVAMTLEYPGIRGDGRASGDAICEYMRLLPLEHHKAVAVNFCPTLSAARRDQIRVAARASCLIYRAFEGISPADVKRFD
jgi:hypothetical protein